MSHPPTVDAAYFHTYNFDAELAERPPVEYIFRKVGDTPITMWYLNKAGEAIEVTDQTDMPYLDLVWDQMAVVRDTADATGKKSAVTVHRFGKERVVIEWFDNESAPAPDPKPSNPFAERTIDTSYLLAPPSHFNGMRVIAHAFLPGDFGALDAHLVIYHTCTDAFRAPSIIDYATPMFGLGRVEYDDDAQKDVPVEILSGVTYSRAMLGFTDALATAQTIILF